jgi:hypothetical protein
MSDSSPLAHWVGDPHCHPAQWTGRVCHDHDDFSYHCHDLTAPPGFESGQMYWSVRSGGEDGG